MAALGRGMSLSFGGEGSKKKDADSFPGLTAEQTKQLRDSAEWPVAVLNAVGEEADRLFNDIDTDHSGTIDVNEFATLLGLLGFNTHHSGHSKGASQLALMLFRTVDRDGSGTIDMLEFYQWLLVFKWGNFDQKCRFGFNMIDQDASGTITIAELTYTVQSVFSLMNSLDLQCPDTKTVAADLMAAMDRDHDANVTYEEFREALLKDEAISHASGGILANGIDRTGSANSTFFGQDKFDFMLAVMVSIERVLEGKTDATPASPTNGSSSSSSSSSSRMLKSMMSLGGSGISSPRPKVNRKDSTPFSPSADSDDAVDEEYEMHGSGAGAASSVKAFQAGFFRRVREAFNIETSAMVQALGVKRILGSMVLGDIAGLSGSVSAGKSGSFFFASADKQFFVKTIGSAESVSLNNMTCQYAAHCRLNPETLLCRLIGHYEMRYGNKSFIFVVMTNVVPSPEIQISQQYDLKGSTYHRTVGKENRTKPGVVLKDNDFNEMRGTLGVGAYLNKLRSVMAMDTEFLRQQGVVDYSLLVMVEKKGNPERDERTWEDENRDQLDQAFEALRTGPGQEFFEGMSKEEFFKFANKNSAVRSRIPKDRLFGGYALPPDGFRSHRINNDDFEEVIGEEKYYIGIIDFLVPFDTKKSAEHTYKTMVGQTNHSVVPPDDYASRFISFATQAIDHYSDEVDNAKGVGRALRRGASSNGAPGGGAAEGSDAEE